MHPTSFSKIKSFTTLALVLAAPALTACGSSETVSHKATAVTPAAPQQPDSGSPAATTAPSPASSADAAPQAASGEAGTTATAPASNSDSSSESVYLTYAHALASGDYGTACANLSTAAQQDYGNEAGSGGGTCEAALSSHSASSTYNKVTVAGTAAASRSEGVCAACSGDISLKINVPAIVIDGESAPATTDYVPMTHESGSWKVDLNQFMMGQSN